MKAELRDSHRSREFFLRLRNALRSPLRKCDGFESEERCAEASRRRPRLTEHGTSIVDGAPDRRYPPSRSYGVTSLPASGGLQPITSHPPSVAAATYGVAG